MGFHSPRPVPRTATVWEIVTVQVPQVAFGQSRNVGAQFPAEFLSDIEKWGGFFAMPCADSVNGGGEILRVLSRVPTPLCGGGVGLAGALGLELGNRAGCALSQQDCRNRPEHDGEK
jgi:hypothetical protein